MNPGDIFWINLPPRAGHTQSGRRPAIVVQSASASTRLPTVLVVPLTSQLAAVRFPGVVRLVADEGNGLRHDSVALVFQQAAVDKADVGERLGSASPEVMDQIWRAFDEITDRR